MSATGSFGGCPFNGDNQVGPRVDTNCRPFDFTLLFEDSFFVALPAALFLLLLPLRLRALSKAPVKMNSYRLAVWKLVIAVLLPPAICMAEYCIVPRVF